MTSWIRGGKISEIAWINEITLAWCSGNDIIFLNIINTTLSIFSSPFYDGATCIAANTKVNIFAFAERCESPRILVYTYPQLTLISECLSGTEYGYLSLDFISSDFLVSLGSYPTYMLILWSWKTGEKLFFIETPVHDYHGQIIRVESKNKLIAQLARDSGKLLVWDIMTSSSVIMMYKQEILLPRASSESTVAPEAVYCDWSVIKEIPMLAIVDKHGHVYLSNKNGKDIKLIVFSQRCGVCLDYEIPIVCWFHNGIILKTTFCQLRYYENINNKNIMEKWTKIDYVKSTMKPYILSPYPFSRDKLFYMTYEGYLMEINYCSNDNCLDKNVNVLKIDEKFNYGGIYNFVDVIYPLGQHLSVIDYTLAQLSIIDVMDGKEISKLNMEMEGQVSNLVTHPDYPIVAIISTEGDCCLVDAASKNLSFLLKYRLQREQLDLIKFSHCGKHLITAQKASNSCYCISSDNNNPFSKINLVKTRIKFIDFALTDQNGILTLFLLALSSSHVFAGNYIVIFTLKPGEDNFQKTHIQLLPTIYQSIHYSPTDSTIFIATPYLSRQTHFLKIIPGHEIILIKSIGMENQLKNLKINTNRYGIAVSGFDGLITVFHENNINTEQATINLSTHHRKDLGSTHAIVVPSKGLITLGRNNGSIVFVPFDEINRNKFKMSDYSPANSNFFQKLMDCKVISLDTVVKEEDGDKERIMPRKSWIEYKTDEKFRQEEEAMRNERLKIKKEFELIKNNIKNMLDNNERLCDNEKLPISTFDLARLSREQKIRTAQEEHNDLRLKLEFECSSMNKVSNWIKTLHSNVLEVPGKSIFSIFEHSTNEVTNYSTSVRDPQEEEMVNWREFYKDIIVKSKANISSKKSEYFSVLKIKYDTTYKVKRSVVDKIMVDDEELYTDTEIIEDLTALGYKASCGTTTHYFVSPFSNYSQYHDYLFSEFILQTNVINDDKVKLQNFFNNIFDEIYELKQQTMSSIAEKNSKIRSINSELQSMFNQTVTEVFPAPQWHWKELPSSIVEIQDHEVTEKAFISPSELQEFLDSKQQMKTQQLSISYNFRKNTLVAMMDDMLEIRWEDVIKKDIIKPEFLLTKQPEEYTAEEIRAFKEYEMNVQALMLARDKYKQMMYNDFERITKTIKEEINKFNNCLSDLILNRIKIDAAIKQLNFLCVREYLRTIHVIKMSEDMRKIDEKIMSANKNIEKINGYYNSKLQKLIVDLKNNHEIYLSKEKNVYKKFNSEFRLLGKNAREILMKLLKLRPRVSLKNLTSNELIELGKYVIGSDKMQYLFKGSLTEYLKNLNFIDVQPDNLPVSITPYYWDRFVKIRRNKIEIELILRANLNDINEIERYLSENKKRIRQLKEDIGNFEDQLIQLERDKIYFTDNIEIQLVLKMEQIEVYLSGVRSETDNSIFIVKNNVENVNQKIGAVAIRKLNAIKKEISYHRDIMMNEWKHKLLKMMWEDCQNELIEIEKFFVIKNINTYLTTPTNGKNEDSKIIKRYYQQKERKNTEMIIGNLEKMLKKHRQKLENIEMKIQLKKTENHNLDNTITRLNVNRWQLELKRDFQSENYKNVFFKNKFQFAVKRSQLVADIQSRYEEMMRLKNHYQSLLMQKYPMKYLEK